MRYQAASPRGGGARAGRPRYLGAMVRSLVAVVALMVTLASCATPNAGRRVMFVVPAELPDGSDSGERRAQLESWILDRAGGFTEAGHVRGAWRDPEGKLVEEANHLYIVSIKDRPAEFERELKRRIVRDFDQQEAYVESW